MNTNSLFYLMAIVFALIFKTENSIAKSNGCMDAKKIDKLKEIEDSFTKLSVKNEIINVSETLYIIYSSPKIHEATFDKFFSNIDLEKQKCGIEIKKCAQNDEQCKYVQSFLAMEYNPIKKDLPKAIRYLKVAENLGSAWSQKEIGLLYLTGKNFPKNDKIALEKFLTAAKQGNQEAQYFSSIMFGNFTYYDQEGIYPTKGVDQDLVSSYLWANVAVASGYDKAVEIRVEVEKLLAPRELKKAQNISIKCINTNFKECD